MAARKKVIKINQAICLPKPKLLAERLFTCDFSDEILKEKLEDEFHEFLETIFPDFVDCSYDYYDCSLEIHGPNVLSQYTNSGSIKSVLKNVGFSTIYVHQKNCKQRRGPYKICCSVHSFRL